MRVECYGATRPRDGASNSEDAFWIRRPAGDVAALCDGAGPAPQCATQVLRAFTRQVESGTLDLWRFPSWNQWMQGTDAAMANGPHCTFVGVAVNDARVVGASAGDSRAWLVNEHGCRVLNERASASLGSGQADGVTIHEPIAKGDTILLMSDGAWTAIPISALHRLVMAARLQHLADLPATLLDAAGRQGRADDMTVVALRVT
ncbi:MAG TPA: PP2C family serine/threonine-protein phosphatase [Luteitalea sp.]|nr:PP2C family serine/threonine-protein phosphatase [Luteitalea sp.]